ncbi:sensor histidine kinase [Rhodovulum sp. BSW8]|uniref:histidine kinase n=1 Tax=Rhodovulum visakhapatnamense TaxID=364297 RepID=A0A4R8FY34_9RHOB|nr:MULTISPECIES: ActS/PrrB/RegB family redox-sensitive histidine kinase [Rhodovulum]OLS43191.1 two-component sensor histidine kinase [Rhodovulum sulfidophilum]MBL3568239.1 ActS/PrrB/RegB family redox-sensitive histidine kinase [Rhodovulum visakhapatnamense]MBL3576623.1 ActS/PrrB/RegB family redox-sensitive histidine kinase [Rhodovulum visakhapatnamense]RBO53288.1 sensor histidine kinase [Rhodovulum sp. BSW8]TDX31911.1 two-component system sensor histidine kinase RegB [Rhodovulum visakhapatname
MSDIATGLLPPTERSNWIRLRTLILLRWAAIAGQVVAIAVAILYFQIQLDLGLCLLVIGASVLANVIAVAIYPENRRLSENEAMLTLLFDVVQLSALLFLTGGLNNPFALMLLTPVTISATALGRMSTLFIAHTAFALITLMTFYHVPLVDAAGEIQELPHLFLFGFWAALVIGISFLGLYADRVTSEMNNMSDALLATQMALAREQKLTDLGGVVAAAAHELGTPLATIKLISSELLDEVEDKPGLREDIETLREQADRCRDILRSMGRAGKDDLHMHTAPLKAVIDEAAEPHLDRGKEIVFSFEPIHGGSPRMPVIYRRPEVIHGLRNLIQNAVDFAESRVWVVAQWTQDEISVRIMDDGPGYPSHLLGRIGDPFVRMRKSSEHQKKRPEYEGMGLGLFIAKTLLERSGATLSFANGRDPMLTSERSDQRGAVVEVEWSASKIGVSAEAQLAALGENTPIEA